MFNFNSRLFTFGCSFTSYHWPTWADILAPKFLEFENWGKGGSSNQHIFRAVIEADRRRKFTAGDTVIIMWSSHLRYDEYKQGKWFHYNDLKHFDNRGHAIRDLACMSAVRDLLKNKNVSYYFLSMNNWPSEVDQDIFSLYEDLINEIKPGFYEVIARGDWDNIPHPSVTFFKKNPKKLNEYVKSVSLLKAEREWDNYKGASWPETFESFKNSKSSFDDKIYDEVEAFLIEIEMYCFKEMSQLMKNKHYTNDKHPTPLQALNYLQKSFPELNFTDSEIDQIKLIEQKILNFEVLEFWTIWEEETRKKTGPSIRL